MCKFSIQAGSHAGEQHERVPAGHQGGLLAAAAERHGDDVTRYTAAATAAATPCVAQSRTL